jgi:hypothetical protein
MDNPIPATIILISGDRDFAYAISVLRFRQYQAVIVVPSLPSAHPSLTSQASAVLEWDADVLRKRKVLNNSSGSSSSSNSFQSKSDFAVHSSM